MDNGEFQQLVLEYFGKVLDRLEAVEKSQ